MPPLQYKALFRKRISGSSDDDGLNRDCVAMGNFEGAVLEGAKAPGRGARALGKHHDRASPENRFVTLFHHGVSAARGPSANWDIATKAHVPADHRHLEILGFRHPFEMALQAKEHQDVDEGEVVGDDDGRS